MCVSVINDYAIVYKGVVTSVCKSVSAIVKEGAVTSMFISVFALRNQNRNENQICRK